MSRAAVGKRRTEKLERRRAILDTRLAVSQSPGERIAAAVDYLRAALKDAPNQVAESAASAVVDTVLVHAEQITQTSQPGGNIP